MSDETMIVVVRNSRAEEDRWGYGRGGIITKTVTISVLCPQCGERRGEPTSHNFCDDGDWATVHVWKNPCGHVDYYSAVLDEAKEREESMSYQEFMSEMLYAPSWMTCDHHSYHREGKSRVYRACGEKAFQRAFDADGVTGFLCRDHAGLNQEDVHF